MVGLTTALALGVTAVGAGLSANSANKASKRAAQTSADNTASNNALARDMYGQNQQALNPFMQRGNAAGNQINALLGLGGGSQRQGGPAFVGALPGTQPNAMSQFQPQATGFGSGVFNDAMGAIRPQNGAVQQFMPANVPGETMPTGTGVPQGQTAQQAANGAFDIFRNSTGYQFRLGEGMDAVTSAYAGIGGFQSGAALRGINEYGQNFASNEFGNYMNALGGQQAVGAGAASSLAGVGQNYASTVINSNNLNSQNQMNAQLSKQNVLGNMLGTVGGGALGFLSGGR